MTPHSNEYKLRASFGFRFANIRKGQSEIGIPETAHRCMRLKMSNSYIAHLT
jgi:hypothetical protein